MTIILDPENQEMEGFAIVYFSDEGFELFASNINNIKLETVITNYPSLMGIMQNQELEGLATTKLNKNLFLFAFAINVRNLEAQDHRLKKKTLTIINFIVTREIYKKLMIYFDEFEKFLEDYFQPIAFIFDLYAIDFTKIIPMFLQKLNDSNDSKTRSMVSEHSLALEFNRWLSNAKFKEIEENRK
ncbi:MAG: hypothetical protein KAS63_05040 [Candidatus Heimdallarchaeota archaeon]|nr:hypothetical protein [Candidatus Heimdallarchaeota archaeon]MCK4954701.1 hypothetical protein [Candidatus Heimdallarchaeota archaeon]